MSQTPKKIVSKGEYAKAQAERTYLGFMGFSLFLVTLSLLYIAWFCGTNQVQGWRGIYGWLVCFLLCKGAYRLAKKGRNTIRQAIQLDPGIPLTRANTGDLPADESLVRASEQPVLPQQAVLLRPATETQDSHEEQLLRPS